MALHHGRCQLPPIKPGPERVGWSPGGGGHSLYSGIRLCAAHVGRHFRIFGIWVGRLFSIFGIWVGQLFIILVFGWVANTHKFDLGGSQFSQFGRNCSQTGVDWSPALSPV
jgi:hypothetical protein